MTKKKKHRTDHLEVMNEILLLQTKLLKAREHITELFPFFSPKEIDKLCLSADEKYCRAEKKIIKTHGWTQKSFWESH